MKKLWKVSVNNWGWDRPRTKYFESRDEAEKYADKFPASDNVEYAGRFTDANADILTGKYNPYEYGDYPDGYTDYPIVGKVIY